MAMRGWKLVCACLCVLLSCSLDAAWGQSACGSSTNTFYFNNATCTTTCYFNDTSIWTSSNASLQLPNAYSTVVITGDPDASTSIFISESTQIGCLYLTDVLIYVTVGTELIINNDLISNISSIFVERSSSLKLSWGAGYSGFANLVDESYISVGLDSSFQIGQGAAAAFLLDETSTLQANENAQILINTQNANIAGNVFIDQEAFLNVSGIALLEPTDFSFFGAVIFDAVEVPPATNISFYGGLQVLNTFYLDAGATVAVYKLAYFPGVLLLTNGASVYFNGLNNSYANIIGTGSVVVQQSNVTLTSGGLPFKGGLVLVPSDSYVVLNNMTIQNFTISATSGNVGSFTVETNAVNLASGPFTVPGNFTVSGDTIVSASFHVTGYLVIVDGTLALTGSGIQVDQSIILNAPGDSGQSQLSAITATITTPNVLLNDGSLFSVTSGESTILCNTFSSSGSVHIGEDAMLFINGSFVSAAGSVVRVQELRSHTDPRIDVTQSIYLMDGTVEYSFADTPEKDDPYLVMRAGGTLTGTDAGSYPVDINGATKASFVFKDNSMWILYESKVKHGHSMPWYGWFLIVLGILSVGGFVYLYYRRRTIHRRYQAI